MGMLVLFVLALFSSCKVQQVKTSTREVDSINTRYLVTYRDTAVMAYLKQQSKSNVVVLTVQNGVVNSDTSKLETDHAISTAFIKNGKLYHTLETKNEAVKTTIKNGVKEVEKEVAKSSKKEIKIDRPVEVNKLYWWQKTLMMIGGFSCVILAIYLYALARKGLRNKIFLYK